MGERAFTISIDQGAGDDQTCALIVLHEGNTSKVVGELHGDAASQLARALESIDETTEGTITRGSGLPPGFNTLVEMNTHGDVFTPEALEQAAEEFEWPANGRINIRGPGQQRLLAVRETASGVVTPGPVTSIAMEESMALDVRSPPLTWSLRGECETPQQMERVRALIGQLVRRLQTPAHRSQSAPTVAGEYWYRTPDSDGWLLVQVNDWGGGDLRCGSPGVEGLTPMSDWVGRGYEWWSERIEDPNE